MKHSSDDNAERLNVKKAIISFLLLSPLIFFDIILGSCKIGSDAVLCFHNSRDLSFSDIHELTEILTQLKTLKIDENYKVQIANDFASFLKMKKPIQDQFDFDENDSPAVVKPAVVKRSTEDTRR